MSHPLCIVLRLTLWAVAATVVPAGHAAIIVVNTLADELNNNGNCSLREAVQAANTNVAVDACNAGNSSGAADLILFAVNGEINLGSTLIITQALTIAGNGHALLSLANGGFLGPMLQVEMTNAAHDFSISDLALVNGRTEQLPGSALQIRRADQASLSRMALRGNHHSAVAHWRADYPSGALNRLVVVDCDFSDNLAHHSQGGGALLLGSVPHVEIRRSRWHGNRASSPLQGQPSPGGAIRFYAFQEALIEDSQFSANESLSISGGGAIYATGQGLPAAQMRVGRSTFSDNRTVVAAGGAIGVHGNAVMVLINSTVTRNGQAIHIGAGATAQLTHVTLYATSNSLGFIRSLGTAQIRRSLIFGRSTGGSLCHTEGSGTIASGGFNRYQAGDSSCNPGGSDLPVADPRLLPLEVYGGLVPTLMPMIDSPLIDDASFVCSDHQNIPVTEDARGYARPVAASGGVARCDVGAVEWNPTFDDFLFKHGFDY